MIPYKGALCGGLTTPYPLEIILTFFLLTAIILHYSLCTMWDKCNSLVGDFSWKSGVQT